MDLISLTIDGVQVEVAPGTTVLEAARQAGIRIPTLCYLKDINEIGSFGIPRMDYFCIASLRPRHVRRPSAAQMEVRR